MEHKTGKSREQLSIRCLEDMVEADSPARQVDRFVDEADTSYFAKSTLKETGRPPYDPKDMLKLLIYGMDKGVCSTRKLARECRVNVEVMWLLNELKPDSTTVRNFRRENAESLTRFFNEFAKKLCEEGYIDGKIVAIDGTKIRANNSKRNNFSAKKLDRHIEYIDNKITEYLSEVDKNDRVEELEERKAKYESFKERIVSGSVSEVSTTDPDSRLMMQGNKGTDVSYNVQTAVDSKHKLITGVLVTNEPNDQGQLFKVASSVKNNLGLEEMLVPADKGYYDTDDFKICEENKITTLVAKPEKVGDKEGFFKKEEFTYIPEEDVFMCPAGQRLRAAKPDKRGYKRYRNPKACNNCPMKDNCTAGKRKDLGRHQHADYAERNDKRLKENPKLYKLRQALCEHPFGTVKRTMGIRQFLTRGLKNVTAEASLIFLCYNLKRLRTIQANNPNNTSDNPLCYQTFLSFCVICVVIGFRKKM
jgi:transposase